MPCRWSRQHDFRHRSGASLRSGYTLPTRRPERQFTLTTGRGSTCRERNAVQTKPATSDSIPPEARGKPIELWWQDEARVGQQGSLTYIWAEQGTRPPAPRDQRYDSAYIFGAVCPARGVGAALVLPEANAKAMNLHLAEISRHVSSGAHAVVLLDGAGSHKLGGQLRVPDNMSLLRLPPYSPELNPMENIWPVESI
jgi:hypothetical protein